MVNGTNQLMVDMFLPLDPVCYTSPLKGHVSNL